MPKNANQPMPMIQPINTGAILSDASLDGHLIGKPPASRAVDPDLHDGLIAISSFLRRHQFLSSGRREEGSAVNAGLARIYGPVMEEFAKNQMDRQAAGLRTNTSGASAAALRRVVDCHADALRHGLDCIARQESWLTQIEANLSVIHSKLCPDMVQSGRYRENRVRASNTSFTLPENI